VRAKCQLPEDYTRPNCTLGGIVRGLHALLPHECPHCGFEGKQFAARAGGFGVKRRAALVQQLSNFSPDGHNVLAECRSAQGSVSDPAPVFEHLFLVPEQYVADALSLWALGIHEVLEVALDVRPAELSARGGPPVVSGPSVAH
jgi:hypothetical protein